MTKEKIDQLTKELGAEGVKISSSDQVAPDAKVIFECPCVMSTTHIQSSTRIGRYTYFRGGRIGSLSRIGSFCSIAPDVAIGEGNHPTDWLSTHPFQYGGPAAFPWWPEMQEFKGFLDRPLELTKAAPDIGHDVWIAAGVTIMRGVKIGNGAIIAAGSIVTRDVAPYEIVGGVPAKHIRFRFPKEIIDRLLVLRWWNYDIACMRGVQFNDIEAAVTELERRAAAGLLKPAEVKTVHVAGQKIVTPTASKPSSGT